jgi:hypothetical protein
MDPPSAWGCMNIGHAHIWAALRCRPHSTWKLFNTEYWHQLLASPDIHCQARQITWVSTMERLDQMTCLGRESMLGSLVGGERSGKELFEQRINSYSEYLHMSPLQCYINYTLLVYTLTHTQLNFFPNIPLFYSLKLTPMQLRHTHGPILTFRGFHAFSVLPIWNTCFITWQLNVLVPKCWSTYLVLCIFMAWNLCKLCYKTVG